MTSTSYDWTLNSKYAKKYNMMIYDYKILP